MVFAYCDMLPLCRKTIAKCVNSTKFLRTGYKYSYIYKKGDTKYYGYNRTTCIWLCFIRNYIIQVYIQHFECNRSFNNITKLDWAYFNKITKTIMKFVTNSYSVDSKYISFSLYWNIQLYLLFKDLYHNYINKLIYCIYRNRWHYDGHSNQWLHALASAAVLLWPEKWWQQNIPITIQHSPRTAQPLYICGRGAATRDNQNGWLAWIGIPLLS